MEITRKGLVSWLKRIGSGRSIRKMGRSISSFLLKSKVKLIVTDKGPVNKALNSSMTNSSSCFDILF